MEKLENFNNKKYENFTKNDFEKCENLLKIEQEKLAETIITYTKLMQKSETFWQGCGMKSRANAKAKQLCIINLLLIIQNKKRIKFTASFCEKIIKYYLNQTIQKQLLYKFFSYQNDPKTKKIIFDKNVNVEDFCDEEQFKKLLEIAVIKCPLAVNLYINKQNNNNDNDEKNKENKKVDLRKLLNKSSQTL